MDGGGEFEQKLHGVFCVILNFLRSNYLDGFGDCPIALINLFFFFSLPNAYHRLLRQLAGRV